MARWWATWGQIISVAFPDNKPTASYERGHNTPSYSSQDGLDKKYTQWTHRMVRNNKCLLFKSLILEIVCYEANANQYKETENEIKIEQRSSENKTP